MLRSRTRAFLVPFLATSGLAGVLWGSVDFASSHGSSSTVWNWLRVVAGSTFYSAAVGCPTALGLFLLLPHIRRVHRVGQLLAFIAAFSSLSALGSVIAVAFSDGVSPVTQALPEVLGITAIFFLVTFLGDMQSRLRDEELARERTLRLASDAQVASLESRIRPHFLFNVLNTVLALIPEDPKLAESVLERVTGLLRASLQLKPGGVVSLGEELGLVADYLEIERVRFLDRLRYVIDVPSELEGIGVPAFSVQTLVENSVKHAVSARREGAQIRVRARLDGARVAVTVTDDGPGFAPLALRSGHGLDTLRGRLAAHFGEVGALEIGGDSGGARVTIRVPANGLAA